MEAEVVKEATPTEIMTDYFKAHPEVPAKDVGDVLNVLIQGSISWEPQERKNVVKAALEAAEHPLAKQLNKVFGGL